MTLGYCSVCHKLVSIFTKGELWNKGKRATKWYPESHYYDGTTTVCNGSNKPL